MDGAAKPDCMKYKQEFAVLAGQFNIQAQRGRRTRAYNF
jgi:hypothetical protein